MAPLPPPEKTCAKCHETKPATCFYERTKRGHGQLSSWCKVCMGAARSAYRKTPRGRKTEMSYNKRWAKEHPEQAKRHRQTARQNYREKTLKQIYEVYGDRCVCCGEAEPTMLCLDHINNDGAEHRRKIGVEGSRLRRWVVKNNFPAGLQTLCNNCNMSKELNGGICAHLTTEYIDLDLRSD